MGPVEGLGTRINCFTAKYEGWLPSPKIGDIVTLRGVKVSTVPIFTSILSSFSTIVFADAEPVSILQSGGSTLVGYKNRLRWAIFDPEAGKLHHGDRGEAPQSEGLGDGFGYQFCPFWTAKEAELTHCLRLTDWWLAAVKTIQSKMGHVYQVRTDVSYLSGPRARRVHRLISEASPDLPPNGFFDCTVEVCIGRRA